MTLSNGTENEMKAQRTEYQGIYKLGDFVAVSFRRDADTRNNGLKEWKLYVGSVDDYLDGSAEWMDTWPTLRDCKTRAAFLAESL